MSARKSTYSDVAPGRTDRQLVRLTNEARLKDHLTATNLKMPRINATLNGKEVDVLYEEQHLIIELDDWHYHQDRQAFNSDHARDAATARSASRRSASPESC